MAWYVARSLNVLRDEVNASAPQRSIASDGSIGDGAHTQRTSDHNPCACHSCVCARDITHDPAGGFDSYKFADWLRKRCQSGEEKRVKYIISNRRIASGTINNWNWRNYTGANPHSKHVHISVAHGPSAFDNPMSWGWSTSSEGTFTLQLQKNELTPENREQLRGNGDVYIIQQLAQGHFKQLGDPAYDCGVPDGDYGPRTQDAVRKMQADGGLDQDACVGPATWNYLLNSTGV